VQSFVHKHADKITGVLSCFDRLIFKGYLPISYPPGMENFPPDPDVLLKNVKTFGRAQAQRLQNQAQQLAKPAGRPFLYCVYYDFLDPEFGLLPVRIPPSSP
jgi:hypothetical protein